MIEAEIEEWLRTAYDDEERLGFRAIRRLLLSPLPEGRRGVLRTLRPLHVAQVLADPYSVRWDLPDVSGIERLCVLRQQLRTFFEAERGGQVLPIPTAGAFRRTLGDGARLGVAAWPVAAYLRNVIALEDDGSLTAGARLEAEHQHWLEALCLLNLRTPSREGEAAYVASVRQLVRSRLRAKGRSGRDVEDEAVADVCVELAQKVRASLLKRVPASAAPGVDGARMVIAYWREAVRNAAADVPGGGLLGSLSLDHPHVEAGDFQATVRLPMPPSTVRKLAAEQRDSSRDDVTGSDERSIEEISDGRAARQTHDPGSGFTRMNAICRKTGRSWDTVRKALNRAIEHEGQLPLKDEYGYLLDKVWEARVMEELGRVRRPPGPPRTIVDAAVVLGRTFEEVLTELKKLHWKGSPVADEIDPEVHDVSDAEMQALQEYFRQFER